MLGQNLADKRADRTLRVEVAFGNQEIVREPLIKSEVPAAQGCAAILNGYKPLKMKQSKITLFALRGLREVLDGLVQSFLSFYDGIARNAKLLAQFARAWHGAARLKLPPRIR